MPFPEDTTEHKEVFPAAQGCATLVSAATCGMVLLMVLVVGMVLLFVAPAVAGHLAERDGELPGLTVFILGAPWWATLLIGLVLASFAVVKELAISHALANFLINGLLLLLLLGFGVLTLIGLILPYVSG